MVVRDVDGRLRDLDWTPQAQAVVQPVLRDVADAAGEDLVDRGVRDLLERRRLSIG